MNINIDKYWGPEPPGGAQSTLITNVYILFITISAPPGGPASQGSGPRDPRERSQQALRARVRVLAHS